MAEIQYCLNNMINYELKNASNYATRSTIELRALLKIIDMMNISLSSIYETKNLIRIDVTCSSFIEILWKKYYGESNSCSSNMTTSSSCLPTSEEWATLERFLAKDFVRNVDLIRLTAVLKKRLTEKDLNFIFAVDGLDNMSLLKDNCSSSGENINNLRNYFENLSVPIMFEIISDNGDVFEKLQQIHVYAIRIIYYKQGECVTPEKIGKVLKKIFGLNYFNITTTTTSDQPVELLKKKKIDGNNDDDYDERFSTSASSSDDDDDHNEIGGEVRVEDDVIEKNIESLYKNTVGNKLLDIAAWKKKEVEKVLMKEMNRKRKSTPTTAITSTTDNFKENDEKVRNKPGRPRAVKDCSKKRKVAVDECEE